MRLVIVESPNKRQSIQKYLGAGFEVEASSGHFRDLPRRELGVDLTTFEPTYVIDEDKAGLVAKLRSKAQRAHEVFVATDADREGEAISWHLIQALGLRGAKRMRFTEITPKALQAAVAAAGNLDHHLVDAQQARRVVDRLVGYQVSPLLKAFGSNHSAGRVQSATLHLVVEREKEIEAFQKTPFWTLSALYANGLRAGYATLDKEGAPVLTRLPSEALARDVKAKAQGPHIVRAIETKPVERRPRAPFTTSTLLQAAGALLDLRPSEVMTLAQSLFEAGLITYHRTDSVALSDDAVKMIRAFIAADYPEALPPSPPAYKSKASAQEAHEAIRPTSLDAAAAASLTGDALALYNLIRTRAIACQCKPAVLSQTTVSVESGPTAWRARGSTVVFPSYLRYFAKDEDEADKKASGGDDDGLTQQDLPALTVGQVLELREISSARGETKPPPRYTEASLIKKMEALGIGRPSTYQPTLRTLFDREYLGVKKKQLHPLPRGRVIDQVLESGFADLVDAKYTAKLEEVLDDVASGRRRWKDEVRNWHGHFSIQLLLAETKIRELAAAHPELAQAAGASRPTNLSCLKCSQPLLEKKGPKRTFLGCSGFPACDYVTDPESPGVLSERLCPKCSGAMEELKGKYGPWARCLATGCDGKIDLSPPPSEKCPECGSAMRRRNGFLGCSRYPDCKGTIQLVDETKKRSGGAKKTAPRARAKPASGSSADAACPKCGKAMRERKGPRGPFYGCGGFPACKHTAPMPSAKEGVR